MFAAQSNGSRSAVLAQDGKKSIKLLNERMMQILKQRENNITNANCVVASKLLRKDLKKKYKYLVICLLLKTSDTYCSEFNIDQKKLSNTL